MKKWLAGIVLVVLGAGITTWASRAQEAERPAEAFGGAEMRMGGTPGGGERAMARRLLALLDDDRVKSALGLTDQQIGGLRQILVETETSTVKARAEIEVRGIELRELLRSDSPDHDAVLKKAEEISTLRGDLMKQHIEALLKAKTILTPEQQKKIRAYIERRSERGGPFRLSPERRPGGSTMPPTAPNPPRGTD